MKLNLDRVKIEMASKALTTGEFLELAQAIFPNTIPGKDRKETTLRFEEP